MGLGICTLMTWVPAKKDDTFRGTEDYKTSYAAGIALGALSIVLCLVYTVDFFVSYRRHNFIKRQQQQEQEPVGPYYHDDKY